MIRGTICAVQYAQARSHFYFLCVHLALCIYAAFLSVTLFVCTNASKVNVTRKMVPITGGSRLFFMEFSKRGGGTE